MSAATGSRDVSARGGLTERVCVYAAFEIPAARGGVAQGAIALRHDVRDSSPPPRRRTTHPAATTDGTGVLTLSSISVACEEIGRKLLLL
jgi:hypothetical protein